MDETTIEAEGLLLSELWQRFNQQRIQAHVKPAVANAFKGIIKDALATALVTKELPEEWTDTERIIVVMTDVMEKILNFGIYLKEVNFDLDKLSPCDCKEP